jgi:hypothetical protein
MLDQIVWVNHPGQVVAVEWHVSSSYPQYNAEGRAKWRQYPPPYNGGYATPWAWIDGRNASYQYTYWEAYVSDALSYPTDVGVNITGSYDRGTRTGQVVAEILNGSADPIAANAYIVITEDSINYTGPNGDPWHNHVCRDYVPTETGTPLSVPAGGSDTVVQNFTLNSAWNQDRCNVLVYFQSPVVQSDSSKITYNAAQVPIALITGLQEPGLRKLAGPAVQVFPNPCRGAARISFPARNVAPYRLRLYGVDGSLVRELTGSTAAGANTVALERLSAGIYSFALETGGELARGRITVSN